MDPTEEEDFSAIMEEEELSNMMLENDSEYKEIEKMMPV